MFDHGFIVWGLFAVYGAIWLAYIGWMRRVNVKDTSHRAGGC